MPTPRPESCPTSLDSELIINSEQVFVEKLVFIVKKRDPTFSY